MKYNFWLATLVILTAVTGCKKKAGQTSSDTVVTTNGKDYTDTSASSVRVFDDKGRICVQQSSTYYEVINYYEGATKIPLLLKINKVELCVADSVNKHKVYNISAKSVMDTKDVHWEANFVATDIRFQDNTLLATHEGADSEEDYLKRFSLRDGKEVFSCSYGDMKVAIPNVRDKRFIGYTSKSAASQPIQELKQENVLAIINYGSSEKKINAFKLKLKRSAADIPVYTPEMVLVPANENTSVIDDGKSIIMMKSDEHYKPADVTGFSAQYTFYFGPDNEATILSIPVKNDKLDLAGAKYDHDIFELVE